MPYCSIEEAWGNNFNSISSPKHLNTLGNSNILFDKEDEYANLDCLSDNQSNHIYEFDELDRKDMKLKSNENLNQNQNQNQNLNLNLNQNQNQNQNQKILENKFHNIFGNNSSPYKISTNTQNKYSNFNDLIDEKVLDDCSGVFKKNASPIENFIDKDDVVSFKNNKRIDKTIEHFIDIPNKIDKESNLSNILIYIVTGIFIIFVLDIFTKLGKNTN